MRWSTPSRRRSGQGLVKPPLYKIPIVNSKSPRITTWRAATARPRSAICRLSEKTSETPEIKIDRGKMTAAGREGWGTGRSSGAGGAHAIGAGRSTPGKPLRGAAGGFLLVR